MPIWRRHTEGKLREAVAKSSCIADVVRYLGIPPSGGNQFHIGKMVKKFSISTDHFDLNESRMRWRRASSRKKQEHEKVLVLGTNNSIRKRGSILSRALIESGITYECRICKNQGEWMGLPLILEVDHINSNYWDNRKQNLQILCPNCHSQKHNLPESAK